MKFTVLDKITYFFSSLVRNKTTSKELSIIINKLLDDPTTNIKLLGDYHVLVGTLGLWIGNYPYQYGYVSTWACHLMTSEEHHFTLALYNIIGDKLPDRKTVYRLNKVVEKLKEEKRIQDFKDALKNYPELGDLYDNN